LYRLNGRVGRIGCVCEEGRNACMRGVGEKGRENMDELTAGLNVLGLNSSDEDVLAAFPLTGIVLIVVPTLVIALVI
jgi:hypothetical protein